MPVAETSHIAVRCGVIAAPLPYIVNTTAIDSLARRRCPHAERRRPSVAGYGGGLKEVAEI